MIKLDAKRVAVGCSVWLDPMRTPQVMGDKIADRERDYEDHRKNDDLNTENISGDIDPEEINGKQR